MKHDGRLNRLKQQLDPEPPRMVFTFAIPPAGLTAAEEHRWREEDRRDCERRGVRWFTLDLGAANVQGCSDEP
jgi:hypothetical protein